MSFRWGKVVGFLVVALAWASCLQAAEPGDASLKACQDQLAASRGAVTKIHLPNAAFQAESLVTLDTRLSEALQRQAQDAATIDALRKELDAGRPKAEGVPHD